MTTRTPLTCDACHSAKADWLVVLPSGGCLRFCGHHLTRHQHALQTAGATITGGGQ